MFLRDIQAKIGMVGNYASLAKPAIIFLLRMRVREGGRGEGRKNTSGHLRQVFVSVTLTSLGERKGLEWSYMNPATSLCSEDSSSAGPAVSVRHTNGIRPCSMLDMLLKTMGERWGVKHKEENGIIVRSGMMNLKLLCAEGSSQETVYRLVLGEI